MSIHALCRAVVTHQFFWLGIVTVAFLFRFPIHFLFETPFLMDFELFRQLAVRLLSDGATALYQPVGTAQAVFKYAPLWALFWLPFGWLSSQAGSVVWSLCNVVWLSVTLWLSSRLCRAAGLRVWPITPLLIVALLSRVLSAEFLNGQTDLLWSVLTVVAIWAAWAQRPWLAAVGFSLAISLKLPAAIFLLYLAARQHWRLLGRTVMIGVGLNLLGAALLRPAEPLTLFREWYATLRLSGPDRAFEIGAQSLLALVARFGSENPYGLHVIALSPTAVVGVTLFVQAGLFGLLLLRPSPAMRSLRWLLDSAVLMIFMAAFSPTCWMATYSTLVFPLVVALAVLASAPRATLRYPPALAGMLLTALFSLLLHRKIWRAIGITAIQTESYTYLVTMIPVWLALALAGWLLTVRFHREFPTMPPPA